MMGTYCTYVGKFARGQFFRRYCVRCGHNKAHLGDTELRCHYLEYRKNGEVIPNKEATVKIPPDMRG